MPLRSTRAASAVIAAVIAALPLGTFAQTSNFFVPPKLVKSGTASTPIAGPGSVTVKVFVKKDGSIDPKSATVFKSSNPGDNASALEMVKSATYRPARKDGVAVDAYYTYELKFTAGSTDVIGDASSADLKGVTALLRSGAYAEAKAQATAYLTKKPNDREGYQLLGVADAFLNDPSAAATAFEKAGTIGDKYKALAAKAFADAAADAQKNGNADQAVVWSTKALEFGESAQAHNVRGSAQFALKKYDLAATDLEKARDLARANKGDSHQIAIIEANLSAALLYSGQEEKGIESGRDALKLDPSLTTVGDVFANYYSTKGQTAVKSGNVEAGVAAYEAGAAASPKFAVTLYNNAAFALANMQPKADWKRVKAEADKSLAIDPNDAAANYVAGVALAQDKNTKDALVYLNKAQASAKNGTDTALQGRIADAIKAITPSK